MISRTSFTRLKPAYSDENKASMAIVKMIIAIMTSTIVKAVFFFERLNRNRKSIFMAYLYGYYTTKDIE